MKEWHASFTKSLSDEIRLRRIDPVNVAAVLAPAAVDAHEWPSCGQAGCATMSMVAWGCGGRKDRRYIHEWQEA